MSQTPLLLEMDMDDMFWEIPPSEITSAIEWAFRKVAGKNRLFWASIHRGGLKEPDRKGTGSSSNFRSINEAEIKDYVAFDTKSNNLFHVGPTTLRQGLKGVPIGGFLSAQLSEIWAIWREVMWLGQENLPKVAKVIEKSLHKAHGVLKCHLTLVDTWGYTVAPVCSANKIFKTGTMRSQHISEVSKEKIEAEGFKGWWSPVERVFGCFQWGAHDIFLVNTIPWDGAPGGRVDNIIKHTEPLQKHRVRNFFKEVSILGSVISERLNPHANPPLPSTQPHEPVPVTLMSRYWDNIYIMLLNIVEQLVTVVKNFITLLLHTTYGICLKWEPSSPNEVVWGEGRITSSEQSLGLTRKGVCRVAPFLGPSPPDRPPCSRFGPPNKTPKGFGRRPCPAALVVL